MTKVKIGIDQGRHDAMEMAVSAYEQSLNKIVREYSKIEGVRPLETKDLKVMCMGETFLKDVILEQAGEMKVGNIALSMEKKRDLIELKGHLGFLESIKQFQAIWPEHRGVDISLNDFELQGSEVRFKDLERVLNNRCSVYIEKPETIKFFDLLKSFCETLNKSGFDEAILSQLFNMDRRFIILVDGEFRINVEILKRF